MNATAKVLEFRVPDDLRELDRWVLWRYEQRKGEPTKVPYSVNGKLASSADPSTWSDFDAVMACWCRFPNRYAGIGFVFLRGDGFVGIDLDDCLDDSGCVKRWASGIVETFGDTYMEVSPSGDGIKIWARGSLPANLPGVKVEDGQIEMYWHSRYFTVTGRAFRGAPLEIEDHSADALTLYNGLTNRRKGWALQPLEGGRIPYGRQHSTLISIIGTLRARRVCDAAIEACLQEINELQCEQPGPRENITRMVRSSRNWSVTV